MIIPSRTASPLLPAAPPYARRIGLRCWLRNKIMEWRGRHDAALPIDARGFLPTTQALHRQVDQVAGQIDDALRSELQNVDREIADIHGQQQRWCMALADAELERTRLASSGHPRGSLAADEVERSSRKLSQVIDDLLSQINAAEARIGALAQRRVHLHGAARDIADTWSCRCDELAALHRRGYLRGQRDKARAGGREGDHPEPDLPRHTSRYEWAHWGLVPVTISLDGVGSPLQRMRGGDGQLPATEQV